jgi:hypothetical protein
VRSSSTTRPALARPAATVELVEILRRRLLEAGWDIALGVTDLPLSVARRPVAGHASAPTLYVVLLAKKAAGGGDASPRAPTTTRWAEVGRDRGAAPCFDGHPGTFRRRRT